MMFGRLGLALGGTAVVALALLNFAHHRSVAPCPDSPDGQVAVRRPSLVQRASPEPYVTLAVPVVELGEREGEREGERALLYHAAKAAVAADMEWRDLPDSADCDGGNPYLLIGVLASTTVRSTKAREVLRRTWITFPTNGTTVVVRFLLARDENGTVPPDLRAEARAHKDMVFLDTLEAYKNLHHKIHKFFQWSTRYCPGAQYVLKTDDDSFVRLDRFPELLATLPSDRVYMGVFLKHMPARVRDKETKRLTHIPLPGNEQNLESWPWYASGGGYLMSGDIISALAYPPLPRLEQTAEDRGVGIALFGFNISYISATGKFKPWGDCDRDALLMHYQRDPGLLERRFARAKRGASICGEGWATHQRCALTEQNKRVELDCSKKGWAIRSVMYADLGKHALATGYTGPCSEGPDALVPEPTCVYNGTPTIKEILERECVGKTKCSVKNDIKKLDIRDPCPGQFKRILAAVECGPAS